MKYRLLSPETHTNQNYFFKPDISERILERVNEISELKTLLSTLKGLLIREREREIISGFPGIGKSVLHTQHKSIISDSDSSQFSWLLNKNGEKIIDQNGKPCRNPHFLRDYIQHLITCIQDGKRKLLISSHKEIRDILLAHDIPFTIIYPDKTCKEEYLNRYKERGSDKNFIKLMEANFEKFISEIESMPDQGSCKKIKLTPGKFLSNVINL